ncbi:TetR/AcrR family transcriptional regulator [Oryzifoliimicrobium ureilyticus]|uniref:TetR/AcrR family transcriptional regulator n=1 Tax=Oryzifoliimicrobium ureilyticus TaxID=3113724 RepID=UPI00307681C1
MRVSREKFAENREKIILVAGRMFRERGFDGVGVADIMKAAGFTHGGFYGHFQSKDELAIEVCKGLIAKVEDRWSEIIASNPARPLAALLEHYISWCMIDDPSDSCVFAALMHEVSRSEGEMRKVFNDGLSMLADLLAQIAPGATTQEKRKNGLTTLASMMGAINLARAVEDRALAAEILSSMREKLGARALQS